MPRSKLLLRGDADYIIAQVHKAGHFSIQEFYGGHPRPPIVMNAKKAYTLAEWILEHTGQVSGKKATHDPVTEKQRERARRDQ